MMIRLLPERYHWALRAVRLRIVGRFGISGRETTMALGMRMRGIWLKQGGHSICMVCPVCCIMPAAVTVLITDF